MGAMFSSPKIPAYEPPPAPPIPDPPPPPPPKAKLDADLPQTEDEVQDRMKAVQKTLRKNKVQLGYQV